MPREERIAIMHGTANPELAKAIAREARLPLVQADITRFKNGEISVKNIEPSVRGKHIFVVQPGARDVNNEVMETLIMVDALRRAGADKITVVMPHYPYARQERKAGEREPISAALLASLLHTAGANGLVAIDLHAPSIQGFFPGNFENLRSLHLVRDHLKKTLGRRYKNAIIVSPDVGGLKRAESLAKAEGLGLGTFHKHRPAPGQSEISMYIGPDVKGRPTVLLDDMIDTGGSLVNAAKELDNRGASEVLAYGTHGVLSGNAVERLNSTPQLKKVVVTDTIPTKPSGNMDVISVAPFLGKVVRAIGKGSSVSALMRL